MEKRCAFPGCGKIAASRGKRKVVGGYARFRWCQHHRKGAGKAERLKLNNEYEQTNSA